MARYTGPKRRLERREGVTLFENEGWKKRPTLPGQHPVSRKRPSTFATQFREKQKVKRMYLMTEKQFRRFFEIAKKATGNTGLRFLQLLELRLDNTVYRLGLAKTRNQARQFVTHGHVLVNGKKLDIPSYTVKVGDEIELSKSLTDQAFFKQMQDESKERKSPNWVETSRTNGKVVSEPTRDQIDPGIKEQFIVELYSR